MNTSQTNEDPKRTKNERNHSSNPRTQEPIFNTFFHLLGFFEVRIYSSHLERNRNRCLLFTIHRYYIYNTIRVVWTRIWFVQSIFAS